MAAAAFSSSPSIRLKEALEACSEPCESGDLSKSIAAVAGVVDLLNSVVESSEAASDDAVAEDALEEIRHFLSDSSSNQMVVDAISLELPNVLFKFAALSDRCRESASNLIDHLVSISSPRDMLAILCEVLDNQIETSKTPAYFIPFLSGVSKVFLRIERRHLEQVKVALPVILKVLYVISSEPEEEDRDYLNDLFAAAVCIGASVQEICGKMVGKRKDVLCAILGLYVLQNIALVSRSRHKVMISTSASFVLQFSNFLPFCGFSFFGLITGTDVNASIDQLSEEDGDNLLACFSFPMHGAALTVIWGYINDEVAKTAGEQLTILLNRIQENRIERWQAIGMLKYILSSTDYPWEIKSYSIDLLFHVMEKSNNEEYNDSSADFLSYMPSLFTAMQAIQRIMVGASDALLRKKAFATLQRVISDIPASHRFDILKALITNSNSPSMIAILIDLVRHEIVAENCQRSLSNELDMRNSSPPFWSQHVLELVELILKPPKGGPPSLPEDSDSVLSALNLFRFIILMESKGNTNHSGVLSENALRKAYSEWLLPLRALVAGIQAENEKDDSDIADHIRFALNTVQMVLYHCIELAEDNLKHPK